MNMNPPLNFNQSQFFVWTVQRISSSSAASCIFIMQVRVQQEMNVLMLMFTVIELNCAWSFIVGG